MVKVLLYRTFQIIVPHFHAKRYEKSHKDIPYKVCIIHINKKGPLSEPLYYFCLQTWLPTVQLVLQADWQDV